MLIDDGFLSEFRITDKKEENEMMDLNGSKVGDKFNCENGHRPTIVFISGDNYCCELNGELFLYEADGKLTQHVSENGEHLVSKHEPVILLHGINYQFTIGDFTDCMGWYDANRKSFMNCGNKVCGAIEATNIVKLEESIG